MHSKTWSLVRCLCLLFSHGALTAFNALKFSWVTQESYNDVPRLLHDPLYRMNVGVIFVNPSTTKIEHRMRVIVDELSFYESAGQLSMATRTIEDSVNIFLVEFAHWNLLFTNTDEIPFDGRNFSKSDQIRFMRTDKG
ncbi:MAG: beta-galactosidase [Spirosoma sp.]|nr:beta-galactosidase [Spirosoma sp.]